METHSPPPPAGTIPPESTRDRITESAKLLEVAAERKLQLAKLNLAEKVAVAGGGLVTGILVLTLSNILLLTFTLGIGFGLAQWTSLTTAESFLIISLLYVLLIGLVIWQRERFFMNPVLAVVITKLFK